MDKFHNTLFWLSFPLFVVKKFIDEAKGGE
jgi:hypothetical protein